MLSPGRGADGDGAPAWHRLDGRHPFPGSVRDVDVRETWRKPTGPHPDPCSSDVADEPMRAAASLYEYRPDRATDFEEEAF